MTENHGIEISEVLVLDGGFSTQLVTHVGERVDGDPLWSARFLQTNPDDVLATHLDFLRAGSDIISTNTYQASIGGFVKYLGLSPDDSFALMVKAVQLAKQAREIYLKETPDGQYPLIAGSVGPYGAHLHDGSEYDGSYADRTTVQTIADWHRLRIKALIEGGVDLLAIETIPCLKEAEVLVELLKDYPNVKAWLAFSCRDGKSLSNGENFQIAAKKCWDLNPHQLIAVGVNCCPPKFVAELFSGFNDDGNRSKIPLITYPNSGEKYDPKAGWMEKDKCPPLADFVYNWLDLGVKFVGGCCRTLASDIECIRGQVTSWNNQNS